MRTQHLKRRCSLYLLCLFCLFAGSNFTACDGDPDVRETITDLRVMGIQADPPAAKPGQEVKLKALAAVVPSATITYEWFGCEDPTKAADGCHTSGTSIGTGETATLTLPDGYLKDNNDPAVALRGRYYFVTLVAKTGEQEVVATKRVVVIENPTNLNPPLGALIVYKADGKTVQTTRYTANLEDKLLLEPNVPSAAQTYEVIDPNGKKRQVQEQLYFSWYTTAGTYSKGYLSESSASSPDNDPKNTWVVPKEKPKDPKVSLFLIVRDGRGGVSWLRTEIEIE